MTQPDASPTASPRRKAIQLNNTLTKKLTAYVASAACCSTDLLAAGAVGAVALAGQPAAADIVVVGNNPVKIPFLSFTFGWTNSAKVPWSFDGNGKFSFLGRNGDFRYDDWATYSLRALPGNGFLAGPLAKGARIGPGGAFATKSVMSYIYHYSFPGGRRSSRAGGGWRPLTSGYLGFEFTGSQGLEFGWAHLAAADWPTKMVMSEYAYDTVPGQSIEAGQTSSVPEPPALGLLALGSLGLALWRRKRA